MKTFTTVADIQSEITKLKKYGKSIGFVPTMGYLHEGHVELIRKARQENDLVVLSIFVNPLQFGPNEDFATYPRDIERDKQIAKDEGVDYLFFPAAEELVGESQTVNVIVTKRADLLCGKSRPGHFDGVATILTMLFHIVLPNRAYFGLKDAQQVAIVDGLIKDFHFPIDLVRVATVREKDGLAKSSRNVRLTEAERSEAQHLYKCLTIAKDKVLKANEDIRQIEQFINNYILENTSGTVDYVQILSYPELETVKNLNGEIIIAIAVNFSKARLIDNIIFSVS